MVGDGERFLRRTHYVKKNTMKPGLYHYTTVMIRWGRDGVERGGRERDRESREILKNIQTIHIKYRHKNKYISVQPFCFNTYALLKCIEMTVGFFVCCGCSSRCFISAMLECINKTWFRLIVSGKRDIFFF